MKGILIIGTLLTLLLAATAITSNNHVYAQTNSTVNPANQQKPTEQKQGGQYSGFENSGTQSGGAPTHNANPTPQAPISGQQVQESKNQTTVATPAQNQQQFGIPALAGIGAAIAVGIGAITWYYRKKSKLT